MRDEGQGRAEALVDEIRKTRGRYHAITTHEAIALITAALRAERRRTLEEAATKAEGMAPIAAGNVFRAQREQCAAIAQALREQAQRARGEEK